MTPGCRRFAYRRRDAFGPFAAFALERAPAAVRIFRAQTSLAGGVERAVGDGQRGEARPPQDEDSIPEQRRVGQDGRITAADARRRHRRVLLGAGG